MKIDQLQILPPLARCTEEIRRLHAASRHTEMPAFICRGQIIFDLDRISKLDPRMN